MKTFKPAIIAATVLLVIAASVFAVYKFFPEKEDPLAGTAPTAVGTNLTKIVDRSSRDVKSVEITTDTGEFFAIDFGVDEIGGQLATMRDAEPDLQYDENEMETLSGFVGYLTAMDEVGTSADDAVFGLDNPQRRIKVTFNGGEPITLLLGKATPIMDGGVYIRREDQDKVYTIGGLTTEMLMKTKSGYRDVMLFTPPSSSESIVFVSISRPGQEEFVVAKSTEAVPSGLSESEAALLSEYELLSPVQSYVDVNLLTSEVLDKIASITPEKLIEDNPADLAKYGLDAPTRINYITDTNEEVTLLLGNRIYNETTNTYEGRYVMTEGGTSVISTEEVSGMDPDFSKLSHTTIMTKLFWFHNPQDISSITYELSNGASHTLALSGGGTTTISGVYDGKKVEDEIAKDLYFLTVRFTVAGEYTSDMTYGASAIKITIKLKSDETTTLELCEINSRQYAAIVDGELEQFVVSVTEVRDILSAFDIIANGGELPQVV